MPKLQQSALFDFLHKYLFQSRVFAFFLKVNKKIVLKFF